MPNETPDTIMHELSGAYGTSGINWSYALFPNKATAETFDERCNNAGYRTRNLHQTQIGEYAVQFHHYQD